MGIRGVRQVRTECEVSMGWSSQPALLAAEQSNALTKGNKDEEPDYAAFIVMTRVRASASTTLVYQEVRQRL